MNFEDFQSLFEYKNIDIKNTLRSLRFVEKNGKKAKPGRVSQVSGGDYQPVYHKTLSFREYKNLEVFDGRGLDTSDMNNFNSSFSNLQKLHTAKFDNCKTSKVTDMAYMFSGCSKLKNTNFTDWDTRQVTTMERMFNGCSELNILDLSSFVLRDGINDSGMFTTQSVTELLVLTNDEKLKSLNYKTRFNRVLLSSPSLNANGGNFSNNLTTKNYFEKCAYEPTKISLTEFEQFKKENTPTNQGFGGFFLGWEKVGGGNSNPTSVIDLIGSTFKARWGNPNWDFEENDSRILLTKYKGNSNEVVVPTNFNGKQIVLKDINTTIIPTRVQKFSVDKSGPYKLIIEDPNLNFAFDGNKNLQEVDFSGIDMSNITHMGVMFRGCSNLVKANFSECDFKKLITMEYMFQDCKKLEEVNFENVKTPVLTNASYMFFRCINLNVIDLRSF
ncbi:BspA family leucine-rich repeat surface protein, partial [Enterococcus faecium]